MTTVLAIDSDRWAVATYRANFPGVEVWQRDVREAVAGLAPGAADVVLGGPPCQPYSHSGKREGATDERDCIPDFAAAVARVRPRQFLMENVPGLLTWDGGRHAARVRSELAALGYRVDVRSLDAVYFGVPQFRERVWFWGIREDVAARHEWPAATHRAPSACGTMGLFDDLPAWVTVGEALGIRAGAKNLGAGTNPHFAGDLRTERDITDEPSPCIPAGDRYGNVLPRVIADGYTERSAGGVRYAEKTSRDVTDGTSVTILAQAHAVPRVGLRRIEGASGWAGQRVSSTRCPAPTVSSRSNPELVERAASWMLPACRPDRPAVTISSGGDGHSARETLVEYRWSDEMRAKHPPATAGDPSPAVMAKWHKGGAEGLIESRGLYRRLTPEECLRLQSAPDSFVWPEGITKTARYRVAGNGWACLMAWHLRRALERVDPASRTVLDLFCGGGLGAAGWHGRYWARAECAEAAP